MKNWSMLVAASLLALPGSVAALEHIQETHGPEGSEFSYELDGRSAPSTAAFSIEGQWRLSLAPESGPRPKDIILETVFLPNCWNSLAISYYSSGEHHVRLGHFQGGGMLLGWIVVDGVPYGGFVMPEESEPGIFTGELTSSSSPSLQAKMVWLGPPTYLRHAPSSIRFEAKAQVVNGVRYEIDPEQSQIHGSLARVSGQNLSLVCYSLKASYGENPAVNTVGFHFPNEYLNGGSWQPPFPVLSSRGERALMRLNLKFKQRSQKPFLLEMKDRSKRGSITVSGP